MKKKARSQVVEKKPPMAVISLGTDVDAPRGEKMETSKKEILITSNNRSCGWGAQPPAAGGMTKLQRSLPPAA